MLVIFVFLFAALNVMVHLFVTRRITRMSRLADQVSLGQFNAEEFDAKGSDELSALARSFGRMRTSLASAYAAAGQESVTGFWRVLEGLIPAEDKAMVVALQKDI